MVTKALEASLTRSEEDAPRGFRVRARGSLIGIALGTVACVLVASRVGAAGWSVGAVGFALVAVSFLPAVGPVKSHVWGPLVGACIWLASPEGDVGVRSLGAALAEHLPVVALVLGLAYLSLSLDDAGFFRWCADRAVRWSRGSGQRLFVALFLGVSGLTLFTSNDVVVLAVTPIVLHLGRSAKLEDLTPFLLTLFVAANTASMALYCGNPTNVIIASAVGLGPLEYARRMLLPAAVASAAAFLVLWWRYVEWGARSMVPTRIAAEPEAESPVWTRRLTLKVSTCAICPVALMALVGPKGPARFVGTGAAQAALVVGVLAAALLALDTAEDLAQRKHTRPVATWRRVRRLPFDIVPFLVAFSVLMHGLDVAGLTRAAANAVVSAFQGGTSIGSVVVSIGGVIAVNIASNIPATMFFERLWSAAGPGGSTLADQLAALDPRAPGIFVDGCLYASNFGANLTFIGALAGLMWVRILADSRQGGLTSRVPTVGDFTRLGLLIVPPVTLATGLTIALMRGP